MINLTFSTIFLILLSSICAIQFGYSQEDNTGNTENTPGSSSQFKPKVDVKIEGTANDDKLEVVREMIKLLEKQVMTY